MVMIRDYVSCDAQALRELHFNTIRRINSGDYSRLQVEAWAPDESNSEYWKKRFDSLRPFVAEMNGQVVGYGDLQSDGKIDHFFCHHEWQRQGVGSALMHHVLTAGLQKGVVRFYSEVSVTAKPFFAYFGFIVVSENNVLVRGQELTNYLMEKNIDSYPYDG